MAALPDDRVGGVAEAGSAKKAWRATQDWLSKMTKEYEALHTGA